MIADKFPGLPPLSLLVSVSAARSQPVGGDDSATSLCSQSAVETYVLRALVLPGVSSSYDQLEIPAASCFKR